MLKKLLLIFIAIALTISGCSPDSSKSAAQIKPLYWQADALLRNHLSLLAEGKDELTKETADALQKNSAEKLEEEINKIESPKENDLAQAFNLIDEAKDKLKEVDVLYDDYLDVALKIKKGQMKEADELINKANKALNSKDFDRAAKIASEASRTQKAMISIIKDKNIPEAVGAINLLNSRIEASEAISEAAKVNYSDIEKYNRLIEKINKNLREDDNKAYGFLNDIYNSMLIKVNKDLKAASNKLDIAKKKLNIK